MMVYLLANKQKDNANSTVFVRQKQTYENIQINDFWTLLHNRNLMQGNETYTFNDNQILPIKTIGYF